MILITNILMDFFFHLNSNLSSKEKVTKLLHASSFKNLFHHKTGTKT